MKKADIPLVPTENIPPPWNKAIEIAKKITLPPEAAISDDCAAFYRRAQATWECWFHWLYKLKWNRSHNIPFGNECTKPLEPAGWLLWSLLELCDKVHAHPCPETKNYNHACDWFSSISQEILYRYFFDGKSQGLQKLREDLKVLKTSKSPYSIKENLHFHRLFTASFELARDYKTKFEKTYLRSRGMKKGKHRTPPGFIQALSTYATELDRNPDLVTYCIKEVSPGSKTTKYKFVCYHEKAEIPVPLEIPTRKPIRSKKKESLKPFVDKASKVQSDSKPTAQIALDLELRKSKVLATQK
jgi:hypothetical protein